MVQREKIVALETDARSAAYFRRRFIGMFGMKSQRSLDETVSIVQSMYPEDSISTARQSLRDLIGVPVKYAEGKYFVLHRFGEGEKNNYIIQDFRT